MTAYSGYSGYSGVGFSGTWVAGIMEFDRDLDRRMKVITGHEAVQLQKDFYESKTPQKAPHNLFSHAESCRMWFRYHREYWNFYQRFRQAYIKKGLKPPILGRNGFKKLSDSIPSSKETSKK
jgi:hypothetical protein